MLAGVALAWLLSWPAIVRDRVRFCVYACLALFALGATNLRFVLREISNFGENTTQTEHRPYVEPGEIAALDWVASHTPPSAAIQPLPWLQFIRTPDGRGHVATVDSTLACVTPGLIDRKVFCGHWGETPAFKETLKDLGRLCWPDTDDRARVKLLRRMRVQYLVFSQKQQELPDESAGAALQRSQANGSEAQPSLAASADALMPMLRGRAVLPPYLQRVYSNPDADVYQVIPSLFPAATSPPIDERGSAIPKSGAHSSP
jgi:hypothetical protein